MKERLASPALAERIRQTAGRICLSLSLLCSLEPPDQREFPYPQDTKIVAVGDSFAAGSGAGNYTVASNNKSNLCRRSLDSPLAHISDRYRLPNAVNIACRGASIADLYKGQYDERSQLETLPPDSDVVLVSIGGNLTNLNELFDHCNKNLCSHHDTTVSGVLDRLQSSEFKQELQQAYRTILQRAPHADIYLTLYPSPIKQRGICPTVISSETDVFVERFVNTLNETIITVARELDSPRIIVVPAPVTDACASLGRGVAKEGQDIGHPTAWANRRIAESIVIAMRQRHQQGKGVK